MAAALPASQKSRISDLIECSVCTDIYNDPRSLPCLHSFCLKCILEFGKDKLPGGKVDCPLCRKQFLVPENGLAGLPKNFFIEQLKDLIEPGTDYMDAAVELMTTQCDMHRDKSIELYCFDCKVTICVICLTELHKAHEWSDVNKVAEEFRRQMTVDSSGLADCVARYIELLDGLMEENSRFIYSTSKAEIAVRQRGDALKQMIDKQTESLVGKLASIRSDRVMEVKRVAGEIEQLASSAKTLISETDELTDKGGPGNIVQQASSLHAKAGELMKVNDVQRAVVDLGSVVVHFTPAQAHGGDLIGKIDVKKAPSKVQPEACSSDKSKYTLFWRSQDMLSQWYTSSFQVDRVTYNCVEQYMMHQKAMCFGDSKTAVEVMATKRPDLQKKLGGKVKQYNEKRWNSVCKEVVKRGNMAKFSQNSKLKEYLLSTGKTILAEASPYDRKWGIGLSADNPRVWDRSSWLGQNLLGEILMEVRSELMQQKKSSSSVLDTHELGAPSTSISSFFERRPDRNGSRQKRTDYCNDVRASRLAHVTSGSSRNEHGVLLLHSGGATCGGGSGHCETIRNSPSSSSASQPNSSALSRRNEQHSSEPVEKKRARRCMRETVVFSDSSSEFHLWYPAEITVDGRLYHCAGQCLLHKAAAELFGDTILANRIMNQCNEGYDNFASSCDNFNEVDWMYFVCGDILKVLNEYKFQQNDNLRQALVDTDNARLIYASPDDSWLGTGCSADAEDISNSNKWRGENYLGKTLIKIRRKLIEEDMIRNY